MDYIWNETLTDDNEIDAITTYQICGHWASNTISAEGLQSRHASQQWDKIKSGVQSLPPVPIDPSLLNDEHGFL